MYRAATFYRHSVQRVSTASASLARRPFLLSTGPTLPACNLHTLGAAPPVSRVSSIAVQPTAPLRTKAVQGIRTPTRKYTTTAPTLPVEEELPLQYGLLYFDNAYPLKMGWWDIRYSLMRPGWKSLERKAKDELVPPENAMPFHFKIGGIEPRLKDGGMFVHFSYVRPSSYSTREALKEIESRCEQHLIGHNHYMWFNFRKVRAFLVKGSPFLEDMASRYPTGRVRVEYAGNANVEGLFTLFRKYGKIMEITMLPPVKDMPRQAVIQYSFMRASTSAKNCLHGAEVNGARMNVTYEKALQSNAILNWLSNHPKITVPLGGMLIAGASFVIFDPIRVFSMHSKITQLFNVDKYPVLKWLRRETIGRFSHLTRAPVDPSLQATGWRQREHDEAKLREWLQGPPESFVIVHGPRGSGKTELVDEVIKEKKHKVIIRCDELANARSDTELLSNLAKQIGYIPLFQFMAAINHMVDMAITATTGQKAGLSATFDNQLEKILDTLTIAIQQASPTKDMSNTSPEVIMKKIEATLGEKAHRGETGECITPTHSLATRRAAKARASKAKGEKEAREWCDPDEIPVVVIDGYMTREKGPHGKELWTHLAEWAAVLVENHVAHVVFLTNNVAATKPLSKALPDTTFEMLILRDASLESSLEFVYKHLDREEYPDLIKPVQILGGRLTDLSHFVHKIKSGLSPEEAMYDILTRAVIEVRKGAFDFDSKEGRSLGWTPIQFWAVMKQLAISDSVNFDELRIHPLFKNNESPFAAMEQAELITIVHKRGRPSSIRPGRPLFHAAFQEILSDTGFSAVMDYESATFLEKDEMVKVAKWEAELKDLSGLLHKDGSWIFGGSKVPKEVDTRVKWVMRKLAESHAKVAKYEQEASNAKKVVASLSASN